MFKESVMAKSEFGFISFAIRPFFIKLNEFLDDPEFKKLLEIMDENISKWEELANKHAQEEKIKE